MFFLPKSNEFGFFLRKLLFLYLIFSYFVLEINIKTKK